MNKPLRRLPEYEARPAVRRVRKDGTTTYGGTLNWTKFFGSLILLPVLGLVVLGPIIGFGLHNNLLSQKAAIAIGVIFVIVYVEIAMWFSRSPFLFTLEADKWSVRGSKLKQSFDFPAIDAVWLSSVRTTEERLAGPEGRGTYHVRGWQVLMRTTHQSFRMFHSHDEANAAAYADILVRDFKCEDRLKRADVEARID